MFIEQIEETNKTRQTQTIYELFLFINIFSFIFEYNFQLKRITTSYKFSTSIGF